MLTHEGELVSDLITAIGQRPPTTDGEPHQGRLFVLAGPAGCGKSHLLHNVWRAQSLQDAITGGGLSAAFIQRPLDIFDPSLSRDAAKADLILWDNFDLCVAVVDALGHSAMLPLLLHRLAARSAVVVLAQRSTSVWRAVARHFAVVVPLKVRQPGQAALCRLTDKMADAPDADETNKAAIDSWATFALVHHYTPQERAALAHSAQFSSESASSFARRRSRRAVVERRSAVQLQAALRRHPACGTPFEELRRIVSLHVARGVGAGHGQKSSTTGAVAASLATSTGVLLHGPPGCGKSHLLALVMSALPDVPFFATSGPEFFSKYLGDTEQRLREAFAEAKAAAPSVLVIEDIDAIAATRGAQTAGDSDGHGGSASVTRRVLASLLCEMDGLEGQQGVLVVATSARIAAIDAAVLRQGRLETHLRLGTIDSPEQAATAATAWLSGFTFADEATRAACVADLKRACLGKPSSWLEHVARRLTEVLLDDDEDYDGEDIEPVRDGVAPHPPPPCVTKELWSLAMA